MKHKTLFENIAIYTSTSNHVLVQQHREEPPHDSIQILLSVKFTLIFHNELTIWTSVCV